MYYRITDWNCEPFAVWYNSKTLWEIAKAIYDIDYRFFEENNSDPEEILHYLNLGDRDIAWFIVEESKAPFDVKDLDF